MIKNSFYVDDVVYDRRTLSELGIMHSIVNIKVTINGKAPIRSTMAVIANGDAFLKKNVNTIITKKQIELYNQLNVGQLILVRKKHCLVLKKKDKFCLLLSCGRVAKLNYWTLFDIIR